MLPLLTASQGLPAPASAAVQAHSEHTNFQCANGLTMQDVASIWVNAISPLSGEDAAAMCVPAVAIAAGSSFDVKGCEKKFQPDAQAGGVKGLWQIADKFYDADPLKQAEAVYTTYAGNDRDYGCLSTWCQEDKSCSEGHFGIGQDEKIMENHRFCKGVWTAETEHYITRVTELGGIDAIRSACSSASKAAGAGVVGNGKRIASTPEEAQLMDFLRQQLMTIFKQDATENMVSKLGEALSMKGLTSVGDAAREIGEGDVSKANEICSLARVDLEGQLLKEWLSDDAARAMMTMTPKEAADNKAEADEDEQQLTDFLREKFAGIYTGTIPDEMTAKIVEIMVSRGVGSLGDAFEVIGLGEAKEAEEIVTMSRLDLEPQLLKEFFDPSKRAQALHPTEPRPADAEVARILAAFTVGQATLAEISAKDTFNPTIGDDGVLWLDLGDKGFYSLQAQPDGQLLLFSPITGPLYYKYDPANKWWDNPNDGHLMVELLVRELMHITSVYIDL